MHVENCLSDIRDQYEHYPFPVRSAETERSRLLPSEVDRLAKIDHYCFGGRRDFDAPMRILIAGGGTGDALIFLAEQLRGKPVEFVFLDMSGASLEIARARAAVRELDNVEWIQASMLDIDKLQLGRFDYINCIGVLHHLQDPGAGLAQLTTCLADDGGMGLMLYGKYGRRNVYSIQELLTLMDGEGCSLPERIAGARATFEDLSANGRLDFRGSTESVLAQPASDAYLVDTYLHGQDRAYTVSDIYDLLGGSDLELAGFTNFFEEQGAVCALEYDPDLFFSKPSLLSRLAELPARRRAHIAELLGASISMHAFYATREPRAAAQPTDLGHSPNFVTGYGERMASAILQEELAVVPLRLQSGVCKELPIGEVTRDLLARIGGGQSIGEILRAVRDAQPMLDRQQVEVELLSMLDLLIRLGLVVLRSAELAPIAPQPSARPWNGAIDLRSFDAL